jgi:molybdopterin synthase sulfur carrier subunit
VDKTRVSVRVRIPTPLRAATDGVSELQSDAATVGGLIAELETRYPAMRGRLRDESGALRRFVNLYVNGEDVRFRDGLETSLASGDELSIVPAVAGG